MESPFLNTRKPRTNRMPRKDEVTRRRYGGGWNFVRRCEAIFTWFRAKRIAERNPIVSAGRRSLKTQSDESIVNEAKNKPTLLRRARSLVVIGSIVALAFVVAFFYIKISQPERNLDKRVIEETDKIIAKIGELIVLPEGEEPTIATVTDPERLKDQSFFKQAKQGDRVLIYTNARKAILYDPVANKIVEVAPLNIGQQ